MRTTIDGAGRVVIPKAIREAAGLEAGGELDVELRDGRVEITPSAVSMTVVERGGYPVIESSEPLPSLTADDVRDVLERVRR